MTRPLSPKQKVENIINHLNKIKGVVTNIHLDYDEDFGVITVINDGFLCIKCVVSKDGKTIQVVKCPQFFENLRNREDETYRYIVHPDSMYDPRSRISWNKLRGLCVKYKHDWRVPKQSRHLFS